MFCQRLFVWNWCQNFTGAGGGDAEKKTQQISKALADRGEETAKRNGHNCGCQKDADDPVECQAIVMMKQVIDGFGQADDGENCTDSSWNQDSRRQMPDSVEKWRIQS